MKLNSPEVQRGECSSNSWSRSVHWGYRATG